MKIQTQFRHRRSVAVLLLSAGLLLAQTVAAAHLHAGEPVDAVCAVCSLAKSETADCDSHLPAPDTVRARSLPPCAASGMDVPARHTAFRPRGPPSA